MSNDMHKYRVWYKKDEEYLDPDYYEGFYMSPDGVVHVGITDWNGICENYQEIPQEQLIVERCTGLKDKNRNFIYAGDVVRWHKSTAWGLGGERKGHVFWHDKFGSFGVRSTLGDGFSLSEIGECEIIGNIHKKEVTE